MTIKEIEKQLTIINNAPINLVEIILSKHKLSPNLARKLLVSY